jgi:hypothetical protein
MLFHPQTGHSTRQEAHLCKDSRGLQHKADKYRVQCTVGGNLIDFPGDKSTKVADIITVKCLINNTVSTPGARAAGIDIKDFYLNNPLPEADEYIRFNRESIPTEIWEPYQLDQYVDEHGYIFARVDKGMYGLPQAGKVGIDFLLPRLREAGYRPTGIVPGLYKHESNSVIFTLVVDDFLIQFTHKQDMDHLETDPETPLHYHHGLGGYKVLWHHAGMGLQRGALHHLHARLYVEKALLRFTHQAPDKPEHATHPWIAPVYGASIQYAEPADTSPQHCPKQASPSCNKSLAPSFSMAGR